MTTMFIKTLQTPFYEHMLGSISSNFSDIVIIGERIEHRLKSGKTTQGSSATTNAKKSRFNPNKKKEGEVQAASATPYWGGYQRQYRPNYRPSSAYATSAMSSYSQSAPRSPAAYRPPFTPNNVFKPTIGGHNLNQEKSQGYG